MRSTFKRSVLFIAFGLVSTHVLSGPNLVPFKATVTIIDSIVGGAPGTTCGQGQLVGTSIGSGNASHLGRLTFEAKDCVTPDPTSGFPPVFNFQGAAGALIITAANGDKLYGTYHGTFTPVPGAGVDSNGLLPYTLQDGRFSIAGGTGKFANAVLNGGVLTGTENLNLFPAQNPSQSTGTLTLTGSISY